MYLRNLHYLRLVIEHGSFAAAAQAAGVSQPAISHGMRKLQAQFSSPLLVRSGRRYVPSDLALQVASDSASLMEHVDALTAARPRPRDPYALRVGLTPSAAHIFGPILYDTWCGQDHRRLLEMTSADEGTLLAGLQRREFDFVISPRPRGTAAQGLRCQSLYQLQPLVYVRRSHPSAGARTLAELQRCAWAAVGPNVRGPVDVLTEAFAVRRMKPPRVAVSCPDYPSLLNLVGHTDLLGVVPHPALIGNAKRQVTPLRLRETLPLYEMCLFEPTRSRSSTRMVIQRVLEIAPVAQEIETELATNPA
jgi:DNA-binding transcriptional LysR family regulator